MNLADSGAMTLEISLSNPTVGAVKSTASMTTLGAQHQGEVDQALLEEGAWSLGAPGRVDAFAYGSEDSRRGPRAGPGRWRCR